MKSELIKGILTNTVFRLFSLINRFIPKNDKIILLYSNMGFRDNIQAIYDYLIVNNYNKTYQIYVSLNNCDFNDVPSGVHVITNISGVFKYLTAGHVFYAFGRIPIYPANGQQVVQMWHGTPFKAPDERQLKTAPPKPYYTKMIISSLFFSEIIKKAHGVTDNEIAVCGQPRTDVMFLNDNKYSEIQGFNKSIIWMPTFRKSSVLGYSDIKEKHSVIPIFESSEYEELNRILKQKNMLLIVKLHPLEDADCFNNMDLGNLMLLTNDAFNSKKWDLYKLISQCDAMITDYSSVFYDFMLLDRPIAFTVDDYMDYEKNRGFAVSDPEYIAAGYKLHNKNEFYSFLNDINANIDLHKEQRREVNELVNTYNDGKQCERVLRIADVKLEGVN